MNVLSLCDGLSCGQMSFEKLGIKISMKYNEKKTIKWNIQFDQNFSWLIVQDLKTGLKLVFENE